VSDVHIFELVNSRTETAENEREYNGALGGGIARPTLAETATMCHACQCKAGSPLFNV